MGLRSCGGGGRSRIGADLVLEYFADESTCREELKKVEGKR